MTTNINLWVEKYRPTEWNEVLGDNALQIKNIVDNGMPEHFLFYGIQGTGKSTIARLIIKYTGSENLIYNGSDETSVDYIRDNVKNFLQTNSSNGKVKIILIEEADNLSRQAQDMLKDLMERKYASNCKFILTCNNIGKISDPIFSRCASFEFKKHDKEHITKRLIYICTQENLKYDEVTLKDIVETYFPDVRKCINKLQQLNDGTQIRSDINVNEKNTIKSIYASLKEGKIMDCRKLWLDNHLDSREVVSSLYRFMLEDESLSISIKKNIVFMLAECDYRLAVNGNSDIQLLNTVIQLRGALNGK